MTDGRGTALRVLQWCAAAVGGLLLGAFGAVVQRSVVGVGGHQLPWGLVLTLGTVFVAVRGAVWWARRRSGGIVVAVGWLVATLVLSRTGPGGDVLLPDDWRSAVYLLGGLVLAVTAIAVPLPRPDEPVVDHPDPEDVPLP